MRGGGVIIYSPSLTSFCPAATCAFEARGNANPSNRRGEPMRRLRFAGAKMLQVLQPCPQAAEVLGQAGHGATDRVAQDLWRRLGAQIDHELTTVHGFFQG